MAQVSEEISSKPHPRCITDFEVSRVAWMNRSNIIYAGRDKWTVDPRVIMLDNTAATEYSVKILRVDVHDEGPYICTVMVNWKPLSYRVNLIVQVPARIANVSADIAVNEGSNITLMCLAVGRPEPTILWKHSVARGRNKLISEGEYIEITAITKEQSGVYECSANNDVSAPDVRTVLVTVNYPPYILNARSTGAPVGHKGILQCEASAMPVADFEWYKEDRRLFNGLNGVKIETKGKQSKLVFFNVSEEDYGNYTCVALNTMGHTNASIILYGPGAVHDVNRALSLSPHSLRLLLTVTLLGLFKF
ncbi:hypothetical protein AAFF_G00190840 [Aldrovandia affinis]|uniref:Ig-like domain-containing protein n=1 Tax=Aldrovandia affinis TaxID=143900 RepID=A0AAD7RJP5_9TELE|nr:hypothetical protein AAFF_G00190840 [Aldrovandia affinis]